MKMKSWLTPRVLYTFLSFVAILAGTFLAIHYAQGGFRITDQGFTNGTGLLAANSFPTGAEVYIDGKLITATDDTLYLAPGEYLVEVKRDGYTTWLKTMRIEEGLVSQTNAKLFPFAPSLTTLTFTGLENISPSPDGQKLIYYVASASASRKNGLYLLELTESPLSFQKGPRQIASDSENIDLASADFVWSPDSSEVMILGDDRQVIVPLNQLSNLDTLPDIVFQRRQILSEWEQEMYLRERQFLSRFPVEIIELATTSAKNVYISPDKKRLLYTAAADISIPETIVPELPATNTQPEERSLTMGGIYIYDREEDKNFKVGEEASAAAETRVKQLLATDLYDNRSPLLNASPSAFTSLQATTSAQTAKNFNVYHSSLFTNTFQWYPDSKHLLFVEDNAIKIIGYDATNKTTLYSGPFDTSFIYPWPDGNRILMKTTFSPETPNNLYAIELK